MNRAEFIARAMLGHAKPELVSVGPYNGSWFPEWRLPPPEECAKRAEELWQAYAQAVRGTGRMSP